MGICLPQPSLEFFDLGAEVACQGTGSFLLEAERVEQRLDVHAATTCASRQVGALAPVSRRAMTCVIAQ
ncbi:hypothetical protein [Streptomyces sp. NPDC048142]|uniref:hypothetical protein n=1 Tax=Streptomyces sp. NPDC048142 TaxID=3365501 RepID=UPI00371C616A